MNKASSALLATAGVTVGLLGFALPAGASVSAGPSSTVGTPNAQVTQHSVPGNYQGNNKDTKQHRDPCHPTRTPCTHPRWQPCSHRTPPCCQPPCDKGRENFGGYVKEQTTKKQTYVCKVRPCQHKPKPCHPKCKNTQPHKRHHCKPERVS